MAININTSYPIEDTSKTTQTNFRLPKMVASKISQVVEPLFNKIKELSTKHLGSPTYLLVNQEDMVAKKVVKISSWLLGISPTILLGAYIYDHLADLYHQHFEKYSRMEEYSDEFSENLESPKVELPPEKPATIQFSLENTIPKILEPSTSTHADDDISDTTSEKDVGSNLGEDNFESVPEEKVNSDVDSREISATSLKSPESAVDVSIVERSQENDQDISNTTPDSLEDSFEKIDMNPELLEEMKNSPEMTSPNKGMAHRVIQIVKGIKAFWANNPFTSNKPNVITSPNTTIEDKPQEFSYKEFEISEPIITPHNTTKSSAIYPTADSLVQIKKDLDRHMRIFVNGQQCHSTEELINQFPVQLNESKTDLLPNSDPITPIVLNFANQTILNFGATLFASALAEASNYSLYTRSTTKENQYHMDPTIHINWDPNFPEKMEMVSEESRIIFNPSSDDPELPLAFYKTRVKVNKDQTEVTWNMIQEPSSETVTNSQNAEEIEHLEPTFASSDEDFEIFEENFEDKDDAISDYDRALDLLLNKPDVCLNSIVTLEYLKSLKIKHPNFVYTDQLMLPISIGTDEIVNSLNKLKNSNSDQTIFLPFLVNGWSVDHAVVAVINAADETIEYFDPKGQSSIWSTRIEKQSNKNVFDFLTELGQKFISPAFSKEKIIHNKKNVPQGFSDNINCGAFCLQFIEERIIRPFDAIENDPIVDPKKLRYQLANRLIENTHSN